MCWPHGSISILPSATAGISPGPVILMCMLPLGQREILPSLITAADEQDYTGMAPPAKAKRSQRCNYN